MKILVRVKPAAKNNKIEKISENEYSISTKAPAKNGKANEAIIRLLAAYFNISSSRICILVGHNIKNKIIEIN
jgi:uncharacterized protein